MSDKTHDQAAISRRAALKKLGLGTVVFVAPTVMTVSEAEAGKRSRRSSGSHSYSKSKSSESSSGKRGGRNSGTGSYDGEDTGEDTISPRSSR